MAEVIRDSLDIVLDGQRTGRWCYGHLTKTEKTHLGTVIEIELQKEYDIPDDGPLDYSIAGIPVDCKYTAEFGNWQIPREMYRRVENGETVGDDHVALLIWAEEASRHWHAGLTRISDDLLRVGGNQDRKRTLRPEAVDFVHWIWDAPPLLPENILLTVTEADRDAIFSFPSGQRRIDELLRRVQHRIIRRTAVLTVAQQDDAMKRPRDARHRLRPEGILVFGHEGPHRRIARELGLADIPTVERLPEKGEFLATRVVVADASDPRPSTQLDGERWVIARPEEPPVGGPVLPRTEEIDEDYEPPAVELPFEPL